MNDRGVDFIVFKIHPGITHKFFFYLITTILLLSGPYSGNSWLAFGQDTEGTTYYVRSTVGNDDNNGTSPDSAWKTVTRGVRDLGPGDTLIVGPGLYRESVGIKTAGLPGKPVKILGDASGKSTGDLPGPVMMAGSVPIDETLFEPEGSPGVYQAVISGMVIFAGVEMDGPQYRNRNVREPVTEVPYVEKVRREKRSLWFEKDISTVYIHTSDDKPPTEHEIELISYHSAFHMEGKPHVWIGGFTFRHFIDGCVIFRDGSDYGRVFDVTAYGCRQGVRIRNSQQVQVLRNILFRNENSGVYYYLESKDGLVQGNTAYENDVGIRFSSESSAGLVLDNLIIGNHDAGLSFESLGFAVATLNSFQDNTSQLRLYKSSFISDKNCYETDTESGHIFAKENPTIIHQNLKEYSTKFGQGLNSREGNCAIEIDRVNVGELHEEATSYSMRAQEFLRTN